MRVTDKKTINRNIDEANEIYKSGHIPTYKDIQWTRAEKVQRDKDMKQFCKSSGESGCDPYWVTTDAYRNGWDRTFGPKPYELQSKELAEYQEANRCLFDSWIHPNPNAKYYEGWDRIFRRESYDSK